MGREVADIPRGRVISLETEREAFKPLEHPIDVRAGLLLGQDTLDNDKAIFVEGVAPITSLGGGVNIVRHDSAGNGIVGALHKALSAGSFKCRVRNSVISHGRRRRPADSDGTARDIKAYWTFSPQVY